MLKRSGGAVRFTADTRYVRYASYAAALSQTARCSYQAAMQAVQDHAGTLCRPCMLNLLISNEALLTRTITLMLALP